MISGEGQTYTLTESAEPEQMAENGGGMENNQGFRLCQFNGI